MNIVRLMADLTQVTLCGNRSVIFSKFRKNTFVNFLTHMKNFKQLVITALVLSANLSFAQTAERPTWDVKDRWEYKRIQKNDGGKITEYSHEIEKIEDGKIIFKGQDKNAEGAFTGRSKIVYSADMNYVSAGANDQVNSPDSRILQWPLEAGKKYASEYEWVNTSTAQKGATEYKATVESFEDVTVPAGTFKAY